VHISVTGPSFNSPPLYFIRPRYMIGLTGAVRAMAFGAGSTVVLHDVPDVV
jgi:hypothetical protein